MASTQEVDLKKVDESVKSDYDVDKQVKPVVSVTTRSDLLTTLLKTIESKKSRGNVGVVIGGNTRIEFLDRGKRYIHRVGSKSERKSFPGGKVEDGIKSGNITGERLAQYQHRSGIREARRRAKGIAGLDSEHESVGRGN